MEALTSEVESITADTVRGSGGLPYTAARNLTTPTLDFEEMKMKAPRTQDTHTLGDDIPISKSPQDLDSFLTNPEEYLRIRPSLLYPSPSVLPTTRAPGRRPQVSSETSIYPHVSSGSRDRPLDSYYWCILYQPSIW